MEERRTPGAPLRQPPPHSSPPQPAARTARAVWRDDAGRVELEFCEGRGLLVVPLASHAAERATMLLEALDRAAGGGQRRVQISRSDLTLEMEFPGGWPEAGRLPSMVIGEGSRFAPPPVAGSPDSASVESVAIRADALGERELAIVREYPLRRRGLAARRRHAEADLLAADDRAGRRDRIAAGLLASSGLALLVATVGAVAARGTLLLAASGAFFAAAVMFAILRRRGRSSVGQRNRLETRLASVADLERELDVAASSLSRTLGCRDPWEAADRLRRAARRIPAPRQGGAEGADLLEVAMRLRRAAGHADDGIDWQSGFLSSRRAGDRGWPAEVSAGSGDLFGPANLLRVAELLRRIDASLDAAWPLVLHEPWPDQDPSERASLLLAVAEVARPRPVVALVDARPAT